MRGGEGGAVKIYVPHTFTCPTLLRIIGAERERKRRPTTASSRDRHMEPCGVHNSTKAWPPSKPYKSSGGFINITARVQRDAALLAGSL